MIRVVLNQLCDIVALLAGPSHPFATEEVAS